ncbi:MAG: hypothetical protein WBB45_07590 [Cyclobacteriaceae bacterium]
MNVPEACEASEARKTPRLVRGANGNTHLYLIPGGRYVVPSQPCSKLTANLSFQGNSLTTTLKKRITFYPGR